MLLVLTINWSSCSVSVSLEIPEVVVRRIVNGHEVVRIISEIDDYSKMEEIFNQNVKVSMYIPNFLVFNLIMVGVIFIDGEEI